MLSPGDPAPTFSLPDPEGQNHSLESLLSAGPLVLYFYPKDHTLGCTKEACGFRDAYQDFVDAGARVVGVSTDDAPTHQSFIDKHSLPFLLLSDGDGSVASAYGVKKTLGLIPGRATFVIDRDGRVVLAFSSQVRFFDHVTRSLDTVRELVARARETA